MNSERDKFLTEAMGECWHEPIRCYDWEMASQDNWKCNKCNEDCRQHNLSFSTWEGFGKLWEWAKKQEWWLLHTPMWAGYTAWNSHGKFKIGEGFINPDRFADAVYEFLKEGKP